MQSRTCFPSPTSGLEDAEYNEPDMSVGQVRQGIGRLKARFIESCQKKRKGCLVRGRPLREKQKDNFGFLVQTGTTTFPKSF
ncbi:hypothetical protein OUZ56_019563 [Daphnia magna]|uniref:Uncharacterized protein n=1 Tax=Daphnia magna TaxID=35525 RepID=A0ABQ9ZBZ3_9CRUS|nr:hypothetical protein OUZ56_019563 [Daphnia magna]